MKERLSNFELLRIISMLLVVLLHANYLVLGVVHKEDILLNPYGAIFRMFADQLCIVAVNLFVMISGWFGINPTIKGAAALLFQVLFYCSAIVISFLLLGIDVNIADVAKMFYVGSSYWFFTEYFILYLFSPVLNKFILNSSKKEAISVLLSFFFIEFLWGWFYNCSNFSGGYSAISFFGVYMLARYVSSNRKFLAYSYVKCFCIAVIFTIVNFPFLAIIGELFLDNQIGKSQYSSPFVILTSLFILLGFSKLQINNRGINWIASSVFSIYLIHCNILVFPLFLNMMRNVYDNLGYIYILFAIVFAITSGFICVLIDKIRIYFWNKIMLFICVCGGG